MKISEIASQIAKLEGKKSQARIGDIREILSILADLSYKSTEPLTIIAQLGLSRAKRKKNVAKS